MKRFFLYLAAVVCLASCNNKDTLWMTPIVDIDSRVTYLEQLCMQMNTNISSMQTIIQALQERDYVTNVAEIKEGNEVIGYTITFAKNPSITIYKGNDGKDGKDGVDGKDGKDGVDGKDGKDGEDGITPQIGVAIDGGIYYWTLNGEWLLDASGNKIRVTGEDGKDGQDGVDGENGQDGKDGEDGQDGTNGQDGITPKLKIENDYWYISYDNGTTWTQLGKAKGDKGETGATGAAGKDGADGKDGQDGKDGDSMFKSVTQDTNYVYFTLTDGSVITIAKTTQVSEGYLISGIIDGHAYVDLDLPSGTKWATTNIGATTIQGVGYYFAWGETQRKSTYDASTYTLVYTSLPDFINLTIYDAAFVNWGSSWELPTPTQWTELVNNCSWIYIADESGWKVVGPNGNAIFLSAVGYIYGERNISPNQVIYASSKKGYFLVNGEGYNSTTKEVLWSSKPNVCSGSYYINNRNGLQTISLKDYCYYGIPIRAVVVSGVSIND